MGGEKTKTLWGKKCQGHIYCFLLCSFVFCLPPISVRSFVVKDSKDLVFMYYLYSKCIYLFILKPKWTRLLPSRPLQPSDPDLWPLWAAAGKNRKSMRGSIVYHYTARRVDTWHFDLNWSLWPKHPESHLTLTTPHFWMHRPYLCITEGILISFVFCEIVDTA